MNINKNSNIFKYLALEFVTWIQIQCKTEQLFLHIISDVMVTVDCHSSVVDTKSAFFFSLYFCIRWLTLVMHSIVS